MGRKAKSDNRAQTERTLLDSAPWAAEHLNLISQGRIEKPNPVRVDVCKYVVNQCLGSPTQKVIGEINTTVNVIRKIPRPKAEK